LNSADSSRNIYLDQKVYPKLMRYIEDKEYLFHLYLKDLAAGQQSKQLDFQDLKSKT